MKTTLRIGIGFFAFFFLYSTTVFGDELKVVTENWKPYNYQDPDTKEIKGVSTRIVKSVLNQTDIKYKIRVYPWNRAYQSALNGENVLIYTIIRTPQRENLFKWIRPLGQGGFSSLYKLRKNTNIRFRTLKEAREFEGKILTNLNSMDHLWLEANKFKNLDVASRVEDSIKKLYGGRAPLIIFNNANIDEEFKSAGFDARELELVLPLFQTPPYMALSPSTDNRILEKIQKAYDALLKTGRLKLTD